MKPVDIIITSIAAVVLTLAIAAVFSLVKSFDVGDTAQQELDACLKDGGSMQWCFFRLK